MTRLLFIALFSIISCFAYVQSDYTETYENGQIKLKGVLVDSILVGKYTEYYENGNIKSEGELSNCEYETNVVRVFLAGCAVGKNPNVQLGKKHGLWKDYYQNGVLKLKYNYFCGLKQGNFYYYSEAGKLESVDFYSVDRGIKSQEYFDNGMLSYESSYFYRESDNKSFDLKSTVESEFTQDGSLKTLRKINEVGEGYEKESFYEYYANGFLRTETKMFDNRKNGLHREFYDNGNLKYEGVFKDDKPINKQYYYNAKGDIIKIETWKHGDLVNTELIHRE